jgi:hypothetical protein
LAKFENKKRETIQPDRAKMGFSLWCTILAHAAELDSKNANYLLLDAILDFEVNDDR